MIRFQEMGSKKVTETFFVLFEKDLESKSGERRHALNYNEIILEICVCPLTILEEV